MIALAVLALVVVAPLALAPAVPVEVTASGPEGPLAGTLIDLDPKAPAVLILPGSGPTDRDGNSRYGVAGGPYRQLAEALAADGIATLRVDKRGLLGSKAAVADGNSVTTSDYADDAHTWIKMLRQRSGRRCIWVLGHSEGGLVALYAAQAPDGICGVILLAAAGRPIGEVMREQFRSNPANAAILDATMGAIDALEAGHRIDATTLPAVIQPLFADKFQPYLIDLFSHDPAKLVAAIKLPVLILQGERDLQTSVQDARLLKQAQPGATLMLLPGVNHVLRPVASDDRAANIATYADATLPISPSIAAAVAALVRRPG